MKVLIVLQLTQLTDSKFQLSITLFENAYFLTFNLNLFLNDTDVTPSLFSPTIVFETPEPTIISETPTIYETPLHGSPAVSCIVGRPSSVRKKSREDTPPNRRRHAQNRVDDRAKTSSKLPIFEGSEDEDNDEKPTDIVRSLIVLRTDLVLKIDAK